VAYADPLGTVSQGSTLTADADGNVSGYVARKRFDYLVVPTPPAGTVAFDATSNAILEGGEVLTWSHTASGSGRHVLVAVCFSQLASESVQSITYGGLAMARLGRSGDTEVYQLANPPTGAQTIVVQFTPGSSLNAVGGAVSVTGVDAAAPVGVVRTASGASTLASVSLPYLLPGSLVVDTIGIPNAVGAPSVTAGSGQSQRWNRIAGLGCRSRAARARPSLGLRIRSRPPGASPVSRLGTWWRWRFGHPNSACCIWTPKPESCRTRRG
jgi:hypothetical protein